MILNDAIALSPCHILEIALPHGRDTVDLNHIRVDGDVIYSLSYFGCFLYSPSEFEG